MIHSEFTLYIPTIVLSVVISMHFFKESRKSNMQYLTAHATMLVLIPLPHIPLDSLASVIVTQEYE